MSAAVSHRVATTRIRCLIVGLDPMLVEYRRHLVRKDLRPRSVVKMIEVLSLFACHVAGRHDGGVLSATSADVEAFLHDRPLAARTRATYVSTIAGLFKWACIFDHVARDPTLRVVRPRMPRAVPHPIRDEDLRLLIEAAPEREAAMIGLAAFHGLRAAEVAGVRRRDILDTNTPPVLIVGEEAAKGGHERVLPLSEAGWALIRPVAAGVRGRLFLDARGRPLEPWAVSHAINGLMRELGIDSTCHSLRHWYGTAVYAASRDLRVTQHLLGHASPSTTAGYVAFSGEVEHAAVAALGIPVGPP